MKTTTCAPKDLMNRSYQRYRTVCGLVIFSTFVAVLLPVREADAECPLLCSGDPLYLTALGDNALGHNNSGYANTALGAEALVSNIDGNSNTALGVDALFGNTGGSDNTAIGDAALELNTQGRDNVAVGFAALDANSTGDENVAVGTGAMLLSSTGNYNTSVGSSSLYNNGNGGQNTAVGFLALYSFSGASNNTAIGEGALRGTAVTEGFSSTGNNNTAAGTQALYADTTGSNNVANGYQALYSNSIGNYNTANGQGALFSNTTGRNNIADGQNALRSNTTGSNNIALGSNAGINLTIGSNNIDIFDRGVAGEANTIRIGRQGTQKTTFIAGISGATVPTGVAVVVDATGHLGTTTSSERFKEAIKPMRDASEAILALKPVTFHYKHELDPAGMAQFGLLAEDVQKVNADLVARDQDGKPYTVRYDAVNAMLLNEFLKEHKTVQEQGATIARQQKQIEALTAAVQKVSEQLELNKDGPKTVLNSH